ncbi:hypothetical protein [Nonomuraea sp. 3-1Str]|nr:hypothetical protein [Nonomuraea sp. 3-1Str]
MTDEGLVLLMAWAQLLTRLDVPAARLAPLSDLYEPGPRRR